MTDTTPPPDARIDRTRGCVHSALAELSAPHANLDAVTSMLNRALRIAHHAHAGGPVAPGDTGERDHLLRIVDRHDPDQMRARYDAASTAVDELCFGRRRWTMSVPVRVDDHDIAISDALEDIPVLLDRIAAVRSIHREFRIYRECGHEHTDDDLGKPGVIELDDVGVVCQAGSLYSICAACCTDGEFQREDCADDHPHDDAPCWPCPTLAALDGIQDQPPAAAVPKA